MHFIWFLIFIFRTFSFSSGLDNIITCFHAHFFSWTLFWLLHMPAAGLTPDHFLVSYFFFFFCFAGFCGSSFFAVLMHSVRPGLPVAPFRTSAALIWVLFLDIVLLDFSSAAVRSWFRHIIFIRFYCSFLVFFAFLLVSDSCHSCWTLSTGSPLFTGLVFAFFNTPFFYISFIRHFFRT